MIRIVIQILLDPSYDLDVRSKAESVRRIPVKSINLIIDYFVLGSDQYRVS